jgi:hypothetical protein
MPDVLTLLLALSSVITLDALPQAAICPLNSGVDSVDPICN